MAQSIDPKKIQLLSDFFRQINEGPQQTDIALPHDDIQLPPTPLDSNRLPESTNYRAGQNPSDNMPQQVPLDSNRLPDVSTRRMGQNPSDQMPSSTPPPLDTNRLPEAGRLPNGGRGYQEPPPAPRPSPTDALHEFFGGGAGSTPPMDSNTPLQVASLRHDRLRQLQMHPEGNNAEQVATLEAQMHNDPFTGDKETARVAGVQHALDVANTENLDPVRQQRQQDEQFTMDKLLKPIQETGKNQLAVEQQKADAARDVASTRADAIQGVADTKAAAGPKLTNNETDTMDKANSINQLGPQLVQMLEAVNPGIENDPTKYGSWSDFLPAQLQSMLYKKGAPGDIARHNIDQAIGTLQVAIPKMQASGRLSMKQYEDLQAHVPQLGFSDGENYSRIKFVLSHILPDVTNGIQMTHGQTPSIAVPPAYNPNDPSTWQREQ